MTKAKVAANNSKNNLRHPKDGSIHKKKQQKFKNTPTGKVSLINNTPSKLNGKQSSPKNGNGVMKSPKSPKSPKSSKGSANGVGAKSSPKGKKKEEEEEDENSEDDINEGISINEIVSGQEDEEDDSDSSDDEAVPDVFTTTLPDATDESDVDFDVKTAENKGVKMFRGVNQVPQEAEESEEEDDDEDDEDEDEDDDNDDEDEDEDKPVLGLSALLGDSIKDESGDEDFVGTENSEDDDDEVDDDDDEDEDESEDEAVDRSLNSSNITSTDDDEEEDDDEDDDEDDEDDDDDDDDDDESLYTLPELLNQSLADDSDSDMEAEHDDEDEGDDEEVSESKKKIKKEKKSVPKRPELTAEELAEIDTRTIFVGNLPKDVNLKVLSMQFKKFGPIETIRMRGIIPEDPKMTLKVAAIKQKFHKKSNNMCVYIVYKSVDSVPKALTMNGKKFEGNYLRVDRCNRAGTTDTKKSVFLGNLPFTVEDNELWDAFKECGRIDSVRIIRHRATGLGRGFGYINFETADGAVLALSLNGTEIRNRKVRVSACTTAQASKKHQDSSEKGGKRKHRSESESNDSPKKIKTEDSETVERATHNSVNAERRTKKGRKRSQGDKQRGKLNSSSPKSDSSPTKFQGQTGGTKNKKHKQDKTSKKKKQIAAKLLAKPKKPSAN